MPTQLVSFWHGPLGWMERMCMASMLRHGHALAVYSYASLDLPAGVEGRDARAIVPDGSPDQSLMTEQIAAFADLFRYVLMQKGAGLWVDLDVYVLQPLEIATPFVFGWEKPDRLNNAVLRIPADSALLDDLLTFARTRPWFGPWWRAKHKWRQRAAVAIGRPLPLSAFPKAQLGPKALTYFARERGLDRQAMPQEVFYPVGPEHHTVLLASPDAVAALLTPQTLAVHLWSSDLKRALGGRMPEPASYLGQLLADVQVRQ